MARDAVANVVDRLRERGCEPRRVGEDAWEARCPAHRSTDHALAITRNSFNQVELECRSSQSCRHIRIVGALGITNEHLYAETPDWLIERMRRVPIERSLFVAAHEQLPPAAEPKQAADLPVVVSATSGTPDSGGREDASDSPAVDCVMADLPGGGEWQQAGNLPLAVIAPAESENMPGSAMELFVSSISVNVEQGAKVERPSAVRILSRLAASVRVFRSADGRFCAQVPLGPRSEILGLRSVGFRDWLIDGYASQQEEPPSNWAVGRVIGMLEARARFSDGIPEVYVRVGRGGGDVEGNAGGVDGGGDGEGTYFVDLGDRTGRAVAISERGCCVVDRPGVHFRRPEGLLALPEPARDGSIDLLRKYVNLSEPDFRLMVAWLTAAMRPVGPYPVLVLNGEQSSGKSTLARILRMLIDPQASPVLALPGSTHDLMVTAANGWLLIYENISRIPEWFSDCICQLAFGGGFASRELFTSDERSVVYAQRPVILVGIDDFVERPDLRDRAVFLHLPPIPRTSRRSERGYWPAFRADYPQILGGLFDAMAGGLRELPLVDLKELPRMADFAEWGEAVGRGLGWGANRFLATYNDNRKEATDLILDVSPVAPLLLQIAKKQVDWSGTPLELYRAAIKGAGKKLGPGWPKTVHQFGTELRKIAPQLRLHGLSIHFERKGGKRMIMLKTDRAADSSQAVSG
jgi:hypothetical protein